MRRDDESSSLLLFVKAESNGSSVCSEGKLLDFSSFVQVREKLDLVLIIGLCKNSKPVTSSSSLKTPSTQSLITGDVGCSSISIVCSTSSHSVPFKLQQSDIQLQSVSRRVLILLTCHGATRFRHRCSSVRWRSKECQYKIQRTIKSQHHRARSSKYSAISNQGHLERLQVTLYLLPYSYRRSFHKEC